MPSASATPAPTRSGISKPRPVRCRISIFCRWAWGLAAHGADPTITLPAPDRITGRYGYAAELGRGKDTPSGHWEMMGLPVDYDWGFFPQTA